MKRKTFFTSDHHFGHKKILKYTNRPWTSVHEMNKALTENWNNTVGKNDIVYYLGDFGLTSSNKLASIMERLNGTKFLVRGNHDSQKVVELFDGLVDNLHEVPNLHKLPVVMCHYPMRSWNRSHHGSICLHGHAHGDADYWFNSFDVGVDSVANFVRQYGWKRNELRPAVFRPDTQPEDYRPVALEEVQDFLVTINGIVEGTRKTGVLHHDNIENRK